MKLVRVMTCVALALVGLAAALVLFGNSAVWAQQPAGERRATDRTGRRAQYGPASPMSVITTSNLFALASAIGVFWGERRNRNPEAAREMVNELVAMYGRGDIKPVISRVYPLTEAPQALLDIAAVAGEVGGGQALQQGPMRRVEAAKSDEMVGQGPVPVLCPGVEGGHQRRLIDQAGLQAQQAEQEVTSDVVAPGHLKAPPARVTGGCVLCC